MSKRFLPINKKDMDERSWKELGVIIVTGDAYVDHPSYGKQQFQTRIGIVY
jgi:hypothetical protein